MIVLDASLLANVVGDDGDDGRLARDMILHHEGWCAPDLADVETVAVLRKRWLAGSLSDRRFAEAVDDLQDLDLVRFPAAPLLWRAYELRANVTAYDATYVALAEELACPLLTGDERLARAPGVECQVEVLRIDR